MKLWRAGRPLITVAIATYDRGAKIESTLRSVQNQTFSNFEVLVVSDGPPDQDLRRTIKKFDKRFKLLQLPSRSGSQSGPNNLARDKANGKLLAYLGHDDIWHPQHLEHLVSVARENLNADFIVAGCLMIGPNGMVDEFTWITGIFSEPGVQAGLDNFFPPSSVCHRISNEKPLPSWQDALSISAPVDSAFMKGAAELGFTFYSTNKISVFKFNSAFRYLSYLLPDDCEQVAMLELCTRPIELNEFIEAKSSIAKSRGAFMELRHPDSKQFEKGEITKTHAKVRGISTVEVREVNEEIQIKMVEAFFGFDWYGLESNGTSSWRWSGPSSAPRFALPFTSNEPIQITFFIIDFITAQIRESLEVFINHEPVAFELVPPIGSEPWKLNVMAKLSREKGSVAELRMSGTCSPSEIDSQSTDTRKLGLCLESIQIMPIGG